MARPPYAHPILAVALLVSTARAQTQTRVYIAPDDHTDYMWTADERTYEKAFLDMLDFYVKQVDATRTAPSEFQARWNCDGWFWLWTYEKNRTAAEFAKLIAQIKSGHITAPLNALANCYGAVPAEAVLRGAYYPGRLERRFGVAFPLAYSIENQTMPYGLASLWAGCGAKYSWKGVCGCASKIPGRARSRQHPVYWYTGPDGARLLMKWYSQTRDNKSLGGYAEANNPSLAVDDVTALMKTTSYPYQVGGAFGHGWDGLEVLSTAFPSVARQKTTATRKVIVSNEVDFFRDFEKQHGSKIPVVRESYGNEWDLLCASLAEVSASVKRSVEKLRSAEAMATLVSLVDPAFMTGREAARDAAWKNLGLYWEHDWTADGPISKAARAAWQRRIEAGVRTYVDRLHADAAAALGSMMPMSEEYDRFFVFNALSWRRTDAADLPFDKPGMFHVVDVSSGRTVPSQRVAVGGKNALRIYAIDVPPVGYRCYDVRPGPGQKFATPPTVTGSVIENARYKITVTGRGAITSLLDKSRQSREFAAVVGGRALNDLGSGTGTLSVENAGAVSATLVARSTSPLSHTTRITLYRGGERIEIDNRIEQNFGAITSWGFGANLSAPDVWHEEVGAVIRAKPISAGGHYATRNARYDWLTMQHFADISGTGGVGLTLSNWDCYFMRLGASTPTRLDTATPLISALAGGQIDGVQLGIQNQGGDKLFTQRFALRTHGGYDQAGAMRFALEHQTPLVAGAVLGGSAYPGTSYTLLEIDSPDALLWALKPAEEGIGAGVVARLWNLKPTSATVSIRPAFGRIAAAQYATHIETPISQAPVTDGRIRAGFASQQMRTLLIKLADHVRPSVEPTGPVAIGRTATFRVRAPGDARLAFLAPCALGTRPGIPFGSRTIPLNADPLLTISLSTPAIFQNAAGRLDDLGRATATHRWPNDPRLVGLRFYTGVVTFNLGNTDLTSISPATQVTISR